MLVSQLESANVVQCHGFHLQEDEEEERVTSRHLCCVFRVPQSYEKVVSYVEHPVKGETPGSRLWPMVKGTGAQHLSSLRFVSLTKCPLVHRSQAPLLLTSPLLCGLSLTHVLQFHRTFPCLVHRTVVAVPGRAINHSDRLQECSHTSSLHTHKLKCNNFFWVWFSLILSPRKEGKK